MRNLKFKKGGDPPSKLVSSFTTDQLAELISGERVGSAGHAVIKQWVARNPKEAQKWLEENRDKFIGSTRFLPEVEITGKFEPSVQREAGDVKFFPRRLSTKEEAASHQNLKDKINEGVDVGVSMTPAGDVIDYITSDDDFRKAVALAGVIPATKLLKTLAKKASAELIYRGVSPYGYNIQEKIGSFLPNLIMGRKKHIPLREEVWKAYLGKKYDKNLLEQVGVDEKGKPIFLIKDQIPLNNNQFKEIVRTVKNKGSDVYEDAQQGVRGVYHWQKDPTSPNTIESYDEWDLMPFDKAYDEYTGNAELIPKPLLERLRNFNVASLGIGNPLILKTKLPYKIKYDQGEDFLNTRRQTLKDDYNDYLDWLETRNMYYQTPIKPLTYEEFKRREAKKFLENQREEFNRKLNHKENSPRISIDYNQMAKTHRNVNPKEKIVNQNADMYNVKEELEKELKRNVKFMENLAKATALTGATAVLSQYSKKKEKGGLIFKSGGWIQKAIKKPGALTASAKRAGMTISQYCAQPNLSTKSKRRCNLAKTLRGFKK